MDEHFSTSKLEGNECFKSKNYKKAIQHYTKCLKIKEDAVVYSNRSQCYINEKMYFLALKDSNSSIMLDPKYTKSYYRRAIANRELCRFELALEDLRKLAQLDPTFSQAQVDIQKVEKILNDDIRLVIKPLKKPDDMKSVSELKHFNLNNQYKGTKLY